MKCSRKYIYLILLLLLLLIIVPNISPKNRRPSNATITESSTKIMDENRIHLSENNSSTEETIFISPETEAQAEIETSQAETERPQAIEGILGYKDADSFPEDMVFASEESIGLLTDIYEEIGFKGEFSEPMYVNIMWIQINTLNGGGQQTPVVIFWEPEEYQTIAVGIRNAFSC